jgi:hypothetical protein
MSLGLNIHTSREIVTFQPNFTTHNGWTNCHRGLDQLSQVTISPPSPGVDKKNPWTKQYRDKKEVGQKVQESNCHYD